MRLISVDASEVVGRFRRPIVFVLDTALSFIFDRPAPRGSTAGDAIFATARRPFEVVVAL